MQNQIQCPVCTLYLHVGMNLQTHLETHPKDQVISALVNLTLLQQNTNDEDEDVTQFRCSTYSPLTQENVSQPPPPPLPPATTKNTTQVILPKQKAIEYHSNASETNCDAIETQPQQPVVPPVTSMTLTKNSQQQVVIVNSCSTSRQIRNDIAPQQQQQSIVSSQILTNAKLPVTKDGQQTTNKNVTIKTMPVLFTAQQILPPPPPYDINNSTYKRVFHQSQFSEHLNSSTTDYSTSVLTPTTSAAAASASTTHNTFLYNNSIRNITNVLTESSLQESQLDETMSQFNELSEIHENYPDENCSEEMIVSENIINDDEKYTENDDAEENLPNNDEEEQEEMGLEEEVVCEDKNELSSNEKEDVIIIDDDQVNTSAENNYSLTTTQTNGVIYLNDPLPNQLNVRSFDAEQNINFFNKKRSRTGLRIISNVKLDPSNAIPITKTIFRNSSFSGPIIDLDNYKPKLKSKPCSISSLPNTVKNASDIICIIDDDNPIPSCAPITIPSAPLESKPILIEANDNQCECGIKSIDNIDVVNNVPVLNTHKSIIESTKSSDNFDESLSSETNGTKTYENNLENIEKPQLPAVHVPVISVQTSVIRMASMHISEPRSMTPPKCQNSIETETEPVIQINVQAIQTNVHNLPPPPPYSEAVSQQHHEKISKTIASEQTEKSFDFATIQSSESSSSRTLLKKPFIKTPKKLVVKFKKPFVPVVEEEANLQPPNDIIISSVQPKIEPNDLTCMEENAETAEIKTSSSYEQKLKMPNSFDEDNIPYSPLRDTYTPTTPYYSMQRDESTNQQTIECTTKQEVFPEEYLPIKFELKTEPITHPAAMEIENLDHSMSGDTDDLHEDKQIVPSNDDAFNQQSDENDEFNNSNQQTTVDNNNDDTTTNTIERNQLSPNCAEVPFMVENEMPMPMAAIVEMKSESWTQHESSEINNATLLNIDTKKEIEVTNIASGGEIFTILTANETRCHQQTITSTSSALQTNYIDTAGPSRLEYGLTTFLGYNDPPEGEDFYSGVPLSPIGFSPDNYVWNQRFSPPFAPFDNNERNSYMDLDMCKNANSNCDRAPSADSLNIRTDEKMPAKGEISEQESNGDIDGSWSHQDTMPRYTSSYDTTVARESWSLSNDQNLLQPNIGHLSTILPKFTPLQSSIQPLDIKPNVKDLAAKISKPSKLTKSRKYRCPVCPKIFSCLKEKRSHLIKEHDSQYPPTLRRAKVSCTTTSAGTSNVSTITSEISLPELPDSFCGSSSGDALLLRQRTGHRADIASMNRYLLNYNWSVLRQKLALEVKREGEEDVKIVVYPTDSNLFMCLVCHEHFTSIKALSAHFTLHPAECYTCGRTFKNWLNFSVHMKRHLNIREYSCLHCTKKFVLRQNLLEHMNTHSGDTPFQCKFCPKRFRRYSNLVQHRNRHHLKIRPKEKDYICACGEVFHSAAKIAWHKETHESKPKCCPYCRERFMHKNSLSRHIRLSHTEQFPLFKTEMVDCPICNQKYMKSSLKTHLAVHSVETPFECTICNKSFTTKWNLKQHKWIHASRSSKPFKCSMCTKAFIREAEYISHVNAHKSIKPYTCDHCGCQFARKYNWLRHTREHETPKKYRCDDCGKVFHRAYYLTEHRRSHTGERPFECIICGKTSTTKTNHNKHVKIHHARDPLTAEG